MRFFRTCGQCHTLSTRTSGHLQPPTSVSHHPRGIRSATFLTIPCLLFKHRHTPPSRWALSFFRPVTCRCAAELTFRKLLSHTKRLWLRIECLSSSRRKLSSASTRALQAFERWLLYVPPLPACALPHMLMSKPSPMPRPKAATAAWVVSSLALPLDRSGSRSPFQSQILRRSAYPLAATWLKR